MKHARTRLRPVRPALGLAAILSAASVLSLSGSAGAATDPGDCDMTAPGTVGAVDHPTEPDAIVLRMAVGGGFVPFEVAFVEQDPTFTLYGSDVAIFQPSEPAQTSLTDPWPPFQCVRLGPDQVDELLTFALEDGGLAAARDEYPHPGITDVPSTTFSIDAAGVDKVVSVQALGFDMAPEEDADARTGFAALADLLSSFQEEAAGAEPYAVAEYAALLTPAWGEPQAEPAAWPWPALALEDFAGDENARTGILTPEQVAAVASVPNGGQVLIPIAAPDGTPLSLSIRPVLPDTAPTPPAA